MLGNVLRNFGSLTTMRVLSRIIHFVVKTYLIRTALDEQVLAHLLHLDLILTTSLHVARSCFKPSYQKVQNPDNILKSSMNIMTLGILATILSALIVSCMEYYQFLSSGKALANFTNAIILYAMASVCQAVAEKYMVECVIKYQYFRIGLIEVLSIIPKTIFIIWAAYFNWFSDFGILVFGVAQVLYSLTLMTIFFALSSDKSLLLQPISLGEKTIYMDPKSKQSLKSFSLLSVLKFFLQEFQNIVLIIMDISHISSIYSLINNLGSIVVRYIFAPLNQIIFNHFSRGKEEQSVAALESFIKSIIYFTVLMMSFGYNYSQTFLRLLYGDKWVSEESILALRTYAVLLVFLGLNGVIEAFLFAKGKDSINRYNWMSIITTGVYLGSTIVFLQMGYGAAGLFLGNIINMSLRIINCWYLQIHLHINLTVFLRKIRPSLLFIATSVAIFLFCHKNYGWALHIFTHSFLTIAAGAFLFAVNLVPIIFEDRDKVLRQIQSYLIKPKVA